MQPVTNVENQAIPRRQVFARAVSDVIVFPSVVREQREQPCTTERDEENDRTRLVQLGE